MVHAGPDPDRALRRAVAASVDAPARLAPVLGDLFAGVHALGSEPRAIARLLRQSGATRGWRVLDLGCGKGAVAVEVARRIGCRVLGVDAHRPFVESARALACRRGVGDRCRFLVGDARRSLPGVGERGAGARGAFDAALMIGLFSVHRAAPMLRRQVRAGGVYVIDDAVRDPRHPGAGAFHALPTRADAERRFASLGDVLLVTEMPVPSRVRRVNAGLYARLSANAGALARRVPRLQPALREFLRRQRRASAILEGPVRPIVWVVRKGEARRRRRAGALRARGGRRGRRATR